MPGASDAVMVRALSKGTLVGHAIACRWLYQSHRVCWITQLVVKKGYRSRGIATRLMSKCREPGDWAYAIASSHAHACMAAVKAFARRLLVEFLMSTLMSIGPCHSLDMDFIRGHATDFLQSSPYVRNAKLRGTLFNTDTETKDTCNCSLDTGFFVDHEEPQTALKQVRAHGLWSMGDLYAGHEFLVILRARMDTK